MNGDFQAHGLGSSIDSWLCLLMQEAQQEQEKETTGREWLKF